MKEEGYVPDTKFVLHDVEKEYKKQNFSYKDSVQSSRYCLLWVQGTLTALKREGAQETKSFL